MSTRFNPDKGQIECTEERCQRKFSFVVQIHKESCVDDSFHLRSSKFESNSSVRRSLVSSVCAITSCKARTTATDCCSLKSRRAWSRSDAVSGSKHFDVARSQEPLSLVVSEDASMVSCASDTERQRLSRLPVFLCSSQRGDTAGSVGEAEFEDECSTPWAVLVAVSLRFLEVLIPVAIALAPVTAAAATMPVFGSIDELSIFKSRFFPTPSPSSSFRERVLVTIERAGSDQ